MTKYILTLFIFISCFSGCKNRYHGKNSSVAKKEIAECTAENHAHHHKPTAPAEPSEESVFNLTSEWKTQEDEVFLFEDLAGKTTVVSMVYTHCQYACPRIVADMQTIKTGLEEKGVEEVNYVLISLDPERDTPQRLKKFYSLNNFDSKWTLLTGDAESIMEIAAVLGVKYKAVSPTDYSHSNLIAILNEGGEIIHRQEGLGASPEETLELIAMGTGY